MNMFDPLGQSLFLLRARVATLYLGSSPSSLRGFSTANNLPRKRCDFAIIKECTHDYSTGLDTVAPYPR